MKIEEEPRRFRDRQVTWLAFVDQVLVRCPRCEGRAEVRIVKQPEDDPRPGRLLLLPRRLICSCGHLKSWSWTRENTWSSPGAGRGEQHDPWFRLPLWLQTGCYGHTLWAFSPGHLAYLREYIAADLRERGPIPYGGYYGCGTTMIDELPAWMKTATHRPGLLRALDKLQNTATRTQYRT